MRMGDLGDTTQILFEYSTSLFEEFLQESGETEQIVNYLNHPIRDFQTNILAVRISTSVNMGPFQCKPNWNPSFERQFL